jgi:hypothetical protein
MSLTEENGLTYVTLDLSEASSLDFAQIQQTSIDTLRISVDGTKTIVKWITDNSVPNSDEALTTTGEYMPHVDFSHIESENGVPSSVAALTTKGPYMTHDEALELMSTEAWTIDLPLV